MEEGSSHNIGATPVSLQRLLPGLSGPLHPKPRLVCGEQVPAEVLENQADAHQGHREEGGRACGGVGRRSGRQAGGEEECKKCSGSWVFAAESLSGRRKPPSRRRKTLRSTADSSLRWTLQWLRWLFDSHGAGIRLRLNSYIRLPL